MSLNMSLDAQVWGDWGDAVGEAIGFAPGPPPVVALACRVVYELERFPQPCRLCVEAACRLGDYLHPVCGQRADLIARAARLNDAKEATP